jgi:hypothetical protein
MPVGWLISAHVVIMLKPSRGLKPGGVFWRLTDDGGRRWEFAVTVRFQL